MSGITFLFKFSHKISFGLNLKQFFTFKRGTLKRSEPEFNAT